MSVKALRRTFAAPFVVTLALAPLAAADTAPNPPPPKKPSPDKRAPAGVNPPGPVIPKPEPAKLERTWMVTKHRGKTAKPEDCEAMQTNTCPKVKPGDPIPPCNPPAPSAYVCPTNTYGIGKAFTEKDTIKIIQRVGMIECVIDEPPVKCDPGEKCNPPPPKKIACPK